MSPHDPVRRFRLPSCIGRPPRAEIERAEQVAAAAAADDARFGDRTLAFFNVGEELEREAEAAELEGFDVAHRALRRAIPMAAAGAGFGLVLAFLLA